MFYKSSHYPIYTTETTPCFYKKNKKKIKKKATPCSKKKKTIVGVHFFTSNII